MKKKNKWFSYETVKSNSEYNIFCFPHAGSGASSYAQWGKFLPDGFSFYPIQYPMRENRHKEELPNDLKTLAKHIAEENMELFISKPAVFYGHCYGAVLAFETALLLRKMANYDIKILVAASSESPRISADTISFETADNKDVADFFIRLGYMDAASLENKVYMDFFMPVLKKDYTIFQEYIPDAESKINSIVYAAYSPEDTGTDPEYVIKWKDFTEKDVIFKECDGGHFFLNEKNACGFFNEISKLL